MELNLARRMAASCAVIQEFMVSILSRINPFRTSLGSNLVSTHLRLSRPSGLSLSAFPIKTLYAAPQIHAICPAHHLGFTIVIILCEEYKL
jgi:hypothetical protein